MNTKARPIRNSSNRACKACWASLLLSLVIAGCGDGGSGGGGGLPGAGGTPPPAGTPPDGGNPGGGNQAPIDLGIDRSGIFFGSITSFGSVVAGGVRYEVTDAEIRVNDQTATQSALASGDVVLLLGDINEDGITGTARSLSVEDALRGRIESLDPSEQTFRMLSQRIHVVPDTIFGAGISPRSFEGLANGDDVVVRGFVAADGRIVASRIGSQAMSSEVRVTGFISTLDAALFTLTINDLAVDYAAAQLTGFPDDTPVAGDFVRVGAPTYSGGVLNAGLLTYLGGRTQQACEAVDVDCSADLEGYVSRFASATNFDVDGFPAAVDDDTVFEGGSLADLGPDAKVLLQGVVDASGRLLADRISFDDDERPIEIEAPVQAIDDEGGIVTLLGIPVRIDLRTRFEDFDQINPSLADLLVGDYLELVGRELENDPARVLATRIEREDPDDEVKLQGFVESISAPDFTVLGVTIRTNALTEFEYDDNETSQSVFFDMLSVGDLVEAEGEQVGDNIIVAGKAEVDD